MTAHIFFKGQRIRVLRDNGRDGIVGYEGVVDRLTQSGVVVILEDDPALKFRMYMKLGFQKSPTRAPVMRFFQMDELEPVEV